MRVSPTLPSPPYTRHESLPAVYSGSRTGIRFRKLSKYLAAEVIGADLKGVMPAQAADIHDAWVVHGVLVLRGQSLTPELLIRFSQQFGTLVPHPAGRFSLDGFPVITVLSNRVDSNGRQVGADRSGMQWHSDRSFRAIPAKGTFLHGVECPPRGAATEFCSCYAAYEALPDAEKTRLSGLRGIHDYGWYWAMYQQERQPLTQEEAGPPVSHPAVCTHPETGWNVLYLSEGVTRAIDGMEADEGRKLVLHYSQYCCQEEFRYVHEWTEGDLVMWDNLAVMHRATEYEGRHHRYMLRTQVEGTGPAFRGPWVNAASED